METSARFYSSDLGSLISTDTESSRSSTCEHDSDIDENDDEASTTQYRESARETDTETTHVSRWKENGWGNAIAEQGVEVIKEYWGSLLFMFLSGLILMFLGLFAFSPLSWKGWMVFMILLFMLVALMNGVVATQITVLAAATIMLALQIISPGQAVAGLSNTGLVIVAILSAVGEGMAKTSVLRVSLTWLMGRPQTLWSAQIRMFVPVAILSAFLHDSTRLVAMAIPMCQSLTKKAGIPISKMLMGLNSSATLGESMTLLGSSASLIVAGMAYASYLTDASGSRLSFPIFDIGAVGVPVCAIGLLYAFIASHFLLKDRQDTIDDQQHSGDPARNYTVSLLVQNKCPLVGESIQYAGLCSPHGLFITELTRSDGTVILAPSQDTRLDAGDVLLIAGVVDTVKELYLIPGLLPTTSQNDKIQLERHRRMLVEAVISPSSDMVGWTVKGCKFRTRFNASIIAIHRHGEHVSERIGDIRLRPGDLLLLECGKDFVQNFGQNYNFALVSAVNGSRPPREDVLHMVIAIAAVIFMGAITVSGALELLTAAMLVVVAMIAMGCMTWKQASSAVSIPLLLTIGGSLALSLGLQTSGSAEVLADLIIDLFSFSHVAVLFVIYMSTWVLSIVSTKNVAVTLMFPIVASPGIGMIDKLNLNPYAALYTLMLAASSNFSAPLGRQTNVMVHNLGRYSWMDWLVFGIPLFLIHAVLSVVLCYFVWR